MSFSTSRNGAAYIHGVRKTMNGSLLECLVEADENKESRQSFSSRIVLVIQDCGKETGAESISMNKLNPCRYGSCRVRNDYGFELLECRCIEQYTGLYCDQLVEWAIYYEVMYYSPFFALIAVVVFICFCHTCVEEARIECPMSFEKHVMRDNLLVDMKGYYPAMFMSPEQV
ncbi:hypothetical protein Y032_0265g669 [Ancylostoma ceylanicum]|uniref:EGF-like domain-containing protein n=1 Tax=Ancylostoma ceylanicum TaxID=53326 RepID=A0A016SA92_9BILA|nr:hypothetical protein Y032_0265g669 [Ancylostoma ceylanicum]